MIVYFWRVHPDSDKTSDNKWPFCFLGAGLKIPGEKKNRDPYEKKDSVEMRLYSSKRWWVGGGVEGGHQRPRLVFISF